MNHKTFLLFALLLNLYGCSKEPSPQLPPATHTGANILACKVNGQVYIATNAVAGVFVTVIPVSYIFYSDSTLVVGAAGNSTLGNTMGTPNFNVSISSKFKGSIGTYSIISTPFNPGGGVYNNDYTTANTTTGGSITYTYYDGYVLAGTFVFDASDSSGHVVHITEGRFDITHL